LSIGPEKATRRVVIIVLDGVGIGAMPDAHEYGDEDSNTLAHTAQAVGGLNAPHLKEMGLGRLAPIEGIPPDPTPTASWGTMLERSKGKDTITGHWEMCGLITEHSFPTYPNGFPQEVINAFERAIGRKVLGNYPASGTEIIKQLGEEHMRTGRPIVYTSADSVFQIAAHEEIIPLEELYEMCRKAREILTGKHNVARVIARPFTGKPGNFRRTENRHDFSVRPPSPTILDALCSAGFEVVGIGKIHDIFAGQGLSHSISASNNQQVIEGTLEALEREIPGLIFANLVDFDMLYGHRNDPQGFAYGLEEFDKHIPEIQDSMRPDDLLILTADHGVDPTTPSTDHSREMVPLLVWGHKIHRVDLGVRSTFADIAATVAEVFGLNPWRVGSSFAKEILDPSSN